ncbi:class I SAM-dependent methyltransferase [Parapusillimonas granuli]|uniref:Methyltransferase domain-containing protein n=1 Tax=Parapusillimonas granuli TaxID=380911 RepID=A0A853G2X4_9BURK|nr:class I SAM-dependent methyltransferase [Parapusillimonas granuli]MBB5215041.1 ubiquinone/menaquinone biosynthesis C-methylase UbiE [Parapusillimonas granuli]MEB2401713.1 class I SAM-dependent methyltransferase [Alcaligenaceae bacterium]NYT49360.1 methyltransferase domain-containing protein [Parapusillimonas granuli]
MRANHSETVQAQFDAQAQAYLQSAVHAAGPDLLRAAELLSQSFPAASGAVMDLGCGAGHLSFALAPLCASVVAVDPSPNMLATVSRAAAEKGLANIQTVQAGAESLPFEDGRFCVVASRYSAHHWLDLPAALKEMRRVVKPGGYLLMIDVEGDENPMVDTHLQTIEILRDRSHVRDRTPSEWARLITDAGFAEIEHQNWATRLAFEPWVTRMRTSPERIAMIRTVQREAPSELREALAIEDDGSFSMKTGLWWAKA